MRRILRWIGIGVGALLVLGVTLWFALPPALGVAIDLTCHEPYDTTCQTRMRALGHLYSARKDIDTALHWYARAANAGDRIAMFHAGWAQTQLAHAEMDAVVRQAKEGNGVIYTPLYFGPHMVSAAEWYRRSADLGFAPAMNNLGEMYRDAYGVHPDPKKAFEYHRRAAEAGNPAGRINLSNDYRNGVGTARDMAEADRWWRPDLTGANPADLAEPTLARTLVGGRVIDPSERDLIRRLARSAAVSPSDAPIRP